MRKRLYGAILGDLAGKPFEKKFDIDPNDIKIYPEDSEITDDTIMTLATADAILQDKSYKDSYVKWGNNYFSDYYGKSFKKWLIGQGTTVNDSYGNGAIMRLSPICHHYKSGDMAMQAIDSIKGSHEHYHSASAVTTLATIYRLIHVGWGKQGIKIELSKAGFKMPKDLKPFEKIDATCQGTLPVVVRIFMESIHTHDAIETAIELGGDTDTNASIVGELAATFYRDISEDDIKYVRSKLDQTQLLVLDRFNNTL